MKTSPDSTIYRTKDGTRVRITKAKQFPINLRDPEWLQEIHRKGNEATQVVRVSDGHALWGIRTDELTPE
jgi:hypothetical protein